MTSQFKSKDVEQFLMNSGNNFASLCWHNDTIGIEFVDSIRVSNWFKKHFPANVNQFLFRTLETQVVQYGTI